MAHIEDTEPDGDTGAAGDAEPVAGTRQVRDAGPDDVEAVVELVQSAYRGRASRVGWTTEADLLDGGRTDADLVRELLADPASRVLVVDDPTGAGLLACCHVEQRDDATYLGMIAVRPDAQGRGIGAAIMRAGEEEARRTAAPHLEITVLNHRPELVAWYERFGFVLSGRTVPFPYGDERYGIPRRPDLVLQVMVKELGVGAC